MKKLEKRRTDGEATPSEVVRNTLIQGQLLMIEALSSDISLELWLAEHKATVESRLFEKGAILFRNFAVHNLVEFGNVVKLFAPSAMEYDYASTPRRELQDRIYTSTEYPADQEILMHNEMSYTTRWPSKVFFYCVHPSTEGGETPLVDSRKMYQDISPHIRDMFEKKGVVYVRNYTDLLDLPWQKVFRTNSRKDVETFCNSHGIEFRWEGDELCTRERAQISLVHQITAEKVWFNQAHLFHKSNFWLDSDNQIKVPRDVHFADDSEIPTSFIQEINRIYNANKIIFSWQKNDLLLVDNFLMAHGRHPFKGERRIAVSLC